MKSFLIGKVLEPESRKVTTRDGRKGQLVFAVLSGRTVVEFTIWEDDRNFDKVESLNDGETVCVIVNSAVDKRGHLQHYLQNIATCTDELRGDLSALFN